MKVRVRFFATLRERVGTNEITKEVVVGCTVGTLWDTLQQDYPKLETISEPNQIKTDHWGYPE